MSKQLQKTPLGAYQNRRRALVATGSPANLRRVIRWRHISLSRFFAEASLVVVWLFIWLANGYLTAAMVEAGGHWLAERGMLARLTNRDWFLIGCGVHIMFALVEGHLWRGKPLQSTRLAGQVKEFWHTVDRWRLLVAVLVGSLDAISAAYWLQSVLAQLFGLAPWHAAFSAVVAAGVAIMAEPMIRYFALGAWRCIYGSMDSED